jgi:hypothetical protein
MRFPSILSAVFALAFSASASADLIPLSIRYDLNVKRNSDVGVEKHFSNNSVLLQAGGMGNLPADNSMLPGSLLDGNNLSFNMTETDGHAIIFITNPFPTPYFNNPPDPAFTYPLVFEGVFYSDDEVPVNVTGFQFESVTTGLPFPSPSAAPVISAVGPDFGEPIGSQTNPIRIQLSFTAAEMGVGQINFWNKIHIFYNNVPEPMSWALALFGAGGLAMVRRRRLSR